MRGTWALHLLARSILAVSQTSPTLPNTVVLVVPPETGQRFSQQEVPLIGDFLLPSKSFFKKVPIVVCTPSVTHELKLFFFATVRAFSRIAVAESTQSDVHVLTARTLNC